MKVLIVEDDREKLRQISACVYEAGVPEGFVKIAGNVIDAKRELSGTGFDLLVLDIQLPTRADRGPEREGGLEVLRWLKTRGSAHRPQYIVGTTAYDDIYKAALGEFDNLAWQIIPFSHGDNGWRAKLSATISLIDEQLKPPFSSDGVSHSIELGIVTALESELEAVERVSQSWDEIDVRHDQSRYYRGQFVENEAVVGFVATCAADKGLAGAAVATTKLVDSFHPRCVAMTGICAGVKGKVSIGDVLVADPTWDWGSGKFRQRHGVEEFLPAAYQMRLNESLRRKVLELRDDRAWFARMREEFGEGAAGSMPNLHIGAVASGASVLQSNEAVKRLIGQHKDLIGVEMEIFSVMFACHVSTLPRPKCIALKSVCDFGDKGKNNNFQRYAAYTSAATLRRLALNGIE